MGELDDAELVAGANRGEEAAFEGLYRRHAGFVLGLARRFTGSEADAQDILQDTFAQLFSRFPGFALGSSLRAFLYPVVRGRAIDVVRRRRRVVDLEAVRRRTGTGGVDPGWEPSPPTGLGALVEALPEGQREVVRLRFVLGMRLEEIAEALAVPVGTVKSRLHHALAALRGRLQAP